MPQEVVLDGDWSSQFYMARALMQLQALFGPIPVIKGKGAAAEAVAANLDRMMAAASAGSSMPGWRSSLAIILYYLNHILINKVH